MNRFFIIMLLFFLSKVVVGQVFIERIYINDSTFYEGYIIEQVPQKYLKIDRIKEKDTLTILMTQIVRLTKIFKQDSVIPVVTKTVVVAKAKKLRYEKAAFFEFLGNGGLYSLNYDMRTERNRINGWGFKIGYSGFKFSGRDTVKNENVNVAFKTIPITINYLFGKNNHFFELGYGATFGKLKVDGKMLSTQNIEDINFEYLDIKGQNIYAHAVIAYRKYPKKNYGIMYRIAITPFFIGEVTIPFIGFSVGYKFK